jgi:hypothetical protein
VCTCDVVSKHKKRIDEILVAHPLAITLWADTCTRLLCVPGLLAAVAVAVLKRLCRWVFRLNFRELSFLFSTYINTANERTEAWTERRADGSLRVSESTTQIYQQLFTHNRLLVIQAQRHRFCNEPTLHGNLQNATRCACKTVRITCMKSRVDITTACDTLPY